MLKLFFRDIDNQYTLDNFRRIEGEINGQIILSANWRLITLTFTAAATNFRYLHNLPYVPLDGIVTRKTGAGSLILNYSLWSDTHIDVTASGALEARILIGRLDG